MSAVSIPSEYGIYCAYFIAITVVAAIIGIAVWSYIENRKNYEKLDQPLDLPDPKAISARVYSKRADIINYGGARFPHSKLTHFVTFLTDDGQMLELIVPQEVFVTLTEQTVGNLVTVDGEFFDFK